MEVSVKKPSITANCSSSNSFDCDSAALDAILGLNPNGKLQLRIDGPQSAPQQHLAKEPAQVYAPLEVVAADPPQRVQYSIPVGHEWVADAEFKRERLVRLLDLQQAWYDAHQHAARAAEELLSLREHHQQQWLSTNQPALTKLPSMTPPTRT